jgi:dephospho-CoA kinase
MEAQSRPRVVGLTGGIASGKSTVGKMLRARGAEVIDADEVARMVVEPGRPAYEKIVAAFGKSCLKLPDPAHPDAPLAIDRERLAAQVFSDEVARRQLNAITHPAIATESAQRIQAIGLRGGTIAIYEAPLLVENKAYLGLNGLIVVDVPEEVQLQRAVQRGMPRAQAEARMRAQAKRAERRAVANWIIDNQGPKEATERQVDMLWADISAGHIPSPQGTKSASS